MGIFLIVLVIATPAVAIALWMTQWILRKSEGPQKMREVSSAIREGAEGFLATQYRSIGKFATLAALVLFLLYLTRPPVHAEISTVTMAVLTAFTFSTGALMSAAAGYVGMWISVRANVRTAAAATRSYQESIDVALRGGAVSGLLVVGFVVLGISTLFAGLQTFFPALPAPVVASLLVGFGFGASLVALFAQLGGGIYTKAADVGADLVGKVEAGIPEDDPRNPAVIADLVGDNVGDCAGRGADLFESISAEIIGAMLLGGSLATTHGLPEDVTLRFMLFPLLIHSLDMLVSSAGVLSVRVKKSGNVVLSAEDLSMPPKKPPSYHEDLEGGAREAGPATADDILEQYGGASVGPAASALEDPLDVLKRGYAVALSLSAVGVLFASRWLLHTPEHPDAWWKFACCGIGTRAGGCLHSRRHV